MGLSLLQEMSDIPEMYICQNVEDILRDIKGAAREATRDPPPPPSEASRPLWSMGASTR